MKHSGDVPLREEFVSFHEEHDFILFDHGVDPFSRVLVQAAARSRRSKQRTPGNFNLRDAATERLQ